MGYSRQLASEQVEIVRRQLGEIIGRFHRGPDGIEEAELAETFELYMIPGEAIPSAASSGYDLHSMLQRTGSWHHLVRSAGRTVGIAQSARPGAAINFWSVHSFFFSPLAAKISAAVARLDAERADDGIEVVLVTVPSYQADFFLLRSGAAFEVYLISGPVQGSGLVEGNFYSPEEFLRKLSTVQPANGITSDRVR
jgi:hypothetical protein